MVTARKRAVLSFQEKGNYNMPGTILSATTKKRLAECHIKAAQLSNSRAQMIEIYKAARYSLVKGELFDSVCNALAKRAHELGVYRESGKNNADVS